MFCAGGGGGGGGGKRYWAWALDYPPNPPLRRLKRGSFCGSKCLFDFLGGATI